MIITPACFQQNLPLPPFTSRSLSRWCHNVTGSQNTIAEIVNEIFKQCQELHMQGINCCMFSSQKAEKIGIWKAKRVDHFYKTANKWCHPNVITSICRDVLGLTTQNWCCTHTEHYYNREDQCEYVYYFEWTQENILLHPVPKMRLDEYAHESHSARFKKLVNSPEHSDVCFSINGQVVFGHKIILQLNPFFKGMFQAGFQESTHDHRTELQHILAKCRLETVASNKALVQQEYTGRSLDKDITPIVISDIELNIFIYILEYMYAGTVSAEAFATVDSTLALFLAADYVDEPGLKKLCVKEIYNLCAKDTYVTIAHFQLLTSKRDDDLELLCKWMPRYFQTIFDDMDMDNLDIPTLFILSQIIEKYNPIETKRKELYDKICTVLKPKLSLNKDFIYICDSIIQLHLRECWTHLLQKILSERRELFEKLVGDKSTDEWHAYVRVSTSAPTL